MTVRDDSPAGMRIPKALKLPLTEKIPHLKAQADESNLSFRINKTQDHAFQKYGNRSKVGMLISMDHTDRMKERFDLDKDELLRKVHTRQCSEFNRSMLVTQHEQS